jgi:hypothetical protein
MPAACATFTGNYCHTLLCTFTAGVCYTNPACTAISRASQKLAAYKATPRRFIQTNVGLPDQAGLTHYLSSLICLDRYNDIFLLHPTHLHHHTKRLSHTLLCSPCQANLTHKPLHYCTLAGAIMCRCQGGPSGRRTVLHFLPTPVLSFGPRTITMVQFLWQEDMVSLAQFVTDCLDFLHLISPRWLEQMSYLSFSLCLSLLLVRRL